VHNNLILGTGCITLAWGAHLGWNLVFMDSTYTWAATGRKLTEPEIFNAIFGYTPILVFLKALIVTSLLIFIFRGK
jgi:hypothetical protein